MDGPELVPHARFPRPEVDRARAELFSERADSLAGTVDESVNSGADLSHSQEPASPRVPEPARTLRPLVTTTRGAHETLRTTVRLQKRRYSVGYFFVLLLV